jgi:hypothetical protein
MVHFRQSVTAEISVVAIQVVHLLLLPFALKGFFLPRRNDLQVGQVSSCRWEKVSPASKGSPDSFSLSSEGPRRRKICFPAASILPRPQGVAVLANAVNEDKGKGWPEFYLDRRLARILPLPQGDFVEVHSRRRMRNVSGQKMPKATEDRSKTSRHAM